MAVERAVEVPPLAVAQGQRPTDAALAWLGIEKDLTAAKVAYKSLVDCRGGFRLCQCHSRYGLTWRSGPERHSDQNGIRTDTNGQQTDTNGNRLPLELLVAILVDHAVMLRLRDPHDVLWRRDPVPLPASRSARGIRNQTWRGRRERSQ